MSKIRKTPEKAVPSLLARLIKAKEYALEVVAGHDDSCSFASKFECIESTLQHMTEPLLQIKNWETMVVEQLAVLDQVLDDSIFGFKDPSEVGDRLKRIEEDVGKLKSLVSMVEQSVTQSPGGNDSENQPLNDDDGGQETADLAVDEKILESEAKYFLSEIFHCLENSRLKKCLALLSVFPESKAIKKRPLIYWWIGEGLVTRSEDATAEEVGEQLFQELLDKSIIKPITTRNSFAVYPSIRRVLIQLAKKNGCLQFSPEDTPCNAFKRAFLWRGNKNIDGEREEDLVTVYNMNEQYLGSRPDLLSGTHKYLEVLQMGRWQDSDSHHIEAQDYEKLLETLGSQKQLKYVSLRGISRIETLPRSIRKLTRLLILDLKACHNLNKLPEEVAELRSLTHLDVSQCYLLDSMPKGLQRLSGLEVLKGFVVSNVNSCKINDLAQLPHLRKLSIRIGKEQSNEQLGSLAAFEALRILTISWGVATSDYTTSVSLPQTLLKLDLRSVPFPAVPPWMKPRELPNLEKLYIKGGKLSTLTHDDMYEEVKFIRLNYLKDLHISQEELIAMFPRYRSLQRTKCKTDELYPDIFLTRAGYSTS